MCHRISQQHGTGTLFRVSLGTHAVGYILYANFSVGITVDYGGTALACSSVSHSGTQALVGGASDGDIGVVAMRYETPSTKQLNWRKTWFFLVSGTEQLTDRRTEIICDSQPNDVQHVMVARITSTTDAPVFSVLDQRKLSGAITVDGKTVTNGNFSGVSTLFHGDVGYAFNSSNNAVSLSVQSGERTGSWSSISTSTQPDETVDLFSAWLAHSDLTAPVDYTVYPATTASSFASKAQNPPTVIRNDGSISTFCAACCSYITF